MTVPSMSKEAAAPASNFLRNIIDADLKNGSLVARTWGGVPGPATTHLNGPADPAPLRNVVAPGISKKATVLPGAISKK